GTYGANPPAETISDFVNTLNSSLININASIYKTTSIKITSTTELNGSIAIPVVAGPIASIFAQTQLQLGNPPLIANRVSDKSLMTFPKLTTPTPSVDTPTVVWLDRQIYTNQ